MLGQALALARELGRLQLAWGVPLFGVELRALAVAVAQWVCRLLPGLWWRPVGSCPAVV